MQIRMGSLLPGAQEAEGLVVVIDVFRCFTTEAVAFANGAKEIVLVAEIEEAFELQKLGRGDLLMGEVGGKKPEGFDFGNSPYELKNVDLTGKTIIQSTRAGTVGVTAASHAEIVYGGSFAVADATVKNILYSRPEIVTLVAMGLEGKIRADEDEQCGLYMRNLLQGRKPDNQAVRSLVISGEESQKYENPLYPQWPIEDREMALDIDSHSFALRIAKEDGYLISRPEKIIIH
ncbi:MAG TPA: 2-phosphosulfolactate phosphatase [Dehalococcoidia bacterium]|nr:2-phosphosulfolactate phosphatase [Chloroflexota bacterium]HCE75198.1 2-phosphosulfolactate phosphatase [Dehalococcoidia bacterium]